MSVALRRYFETDREAFAFASGLSEASQGNIHNIHIRDSDDDPGYPYVVEWISEENNDG